MPTLPVDDGGVGECGVRAQQAALHGHARPYPHLAHVPPRVRGAIRTGYTMCKQSGQEEEEGEKGEGEEGEEEEGEA